MRKEHKEEGPAAVIGKFLSPHGVAGMIKVFPYSDHPDRPGNLKEVTVNLAGARSRVVVDKASAYGRFWLLKLQGVDTREQAALYTGGLLEIPAGERAPLPRGSYYHDQVVGLQVYTTANEHLGEVADIICNGGHDLYLVKLAESSDPPGRLMPLPAVKEFIKMIDLTAERMVVELPEGLDEL